MNKIIKIGLAILLLGVLVHGNSGNANDANFPTADTDCFESIADITITIPFIDPNPIVIPGIQGDTIIKRDDPLLDPISGKNTVAVEILSMSLSGNIPLLGPIDVRIGKSFGLPASTGMVIPINPPPDPDFPAEIFFDVFFEIEIGPVTLSNKNPLPINGIVFTLPPTFPENNFQSLNSVDIFDENGLLVGEVNNVIHIVDPVTCTISQLCPCNGFKNHGKYVDCVVHTSKEFEKSGIITKGEGKDFRLEAAQSSCGK